MTPQRVLEALESAREAIQKVGPHLKPQCANLASKEVVDPETALKHVLWMLPEVEKIVHQNKMDKAFRWLGFIQGVLWVTGAASIDDSRRANMPKDEIFGKD